MRSVVFSTFRRFAFVAIILAGFAWTNGAYADLTTNSPMPIDYTVTINPVLLSNNDSSNAAEFFGSASEEVEIKNFVDTIWAQAGIDVEWLPTQTWNDTWVNVGSVSPRPNSDINTIVTLAEAAGKNHVDTNVINMYFVEISTGFGDLGENVANGLAFVGGNGVSQHVGDNLPGFTAGREVIASVVAHEIGHNLGLNHIVESENLVRSVSSGERLNSTQITTVRGSSFAIPTPVPEPSSATVYGFIVLGLIAIRRRKLLR